MPKSCFGAPFRFRSNAGERVPRVVLSAMITEAMYQLALTIPDEYSYLRGHYSDVEKASSEHLEFV